MQRAEIIDTAIPEPRYQLKGKIFEAGYNSFTDFAKAVDIHRVYLSQVLNGHAFPSPALQRRIASVLGLSLRELKRLL